MLGLLREDKFARACHSRFRFSFYVVRLRYPREKLPGMPDNRREENKTNRDTTLSLGLTPANWRLPVKQLSQVQGGLAVQVSGLQPRYR